MREGRKIVGRVGPVGQVDRFTTAIVPWFIATIRSGSSARWGTPVILLTALILQAAPPPVDTSIRLSIRPPRPIVEYGAGTNYLNFDFILENTGPNLRDIRRVTLSVLDARGRLLHRQFIASDGAAEPAVLTLPRRSVPPGASIALFNPFYALPAHLPLARLRVEFAFDVEGLAPLGTATIEVSPVARRPLTRLTLPLDGPALVYDGHDYYSHHRRIPLDAEFTKRTGLSTNPVRFANDWTPVGPDGRLSRGSLDSIQDWYGYGAAVRAPATGVVVSVANDVPDNRVEKGELRLPENMPQDFLKAALGNHLIIRHRPDEFTLLAHLRAGTVRAAVGDTVREGAEVGEIGFSGDTGFHVHLHQMLMTGPTLSAEGLPSYFDGVQRVMVGVTPSPIGPVVSGVRLDTGDLVSRSTRR